MCCRLCCRYRPGSDLHHWTAAPSTPLPRCGSKQLIMTTHLLRQAWPPPPRSHRTAPTAQPTAHCTEFIRRERQHAPLCRQALRRRLQPGPFVKPQRDPHSPQPLARRRRCSLAPGGRRLRRLEPLPDINPWRAPPCVHHNPDRPAQFKLARRRHQFHRRRPRALRALIALVALLAPCGWPGLRWDTTATCTPMNVSIRAAQGRLRLPPPTAP